MSKKKNAEMAKDKKKKKTPYEKRRKKIQDALKKILDATNGGEQEVAIRIKGRNGKKKLYWIKRVDIMTEDKKELVVFHPISGEGKERKPGEKAVKKDLKYIKKVKKAKKAKKEEE